MRAAIVIAMLAAIGCGRREPREARAPQPLELAVRVLSDTGRTVTLPVRAPARAAPETLPAARAWLAEVAPARADLPASPVPVTDPVTVAPPPPQLIEADLVAPVLKDPAALLLRTPRGSPPASVELDVRVDEDGVVSDALWAGGSDDSTLVAAAIECALGMRFWPARRGDDAVPVWCRQRFDFLRR